jgi:GR25 family glycosyltransferase involved in LPS biosynthesis
VVVLNSKKLNNILNKLKKIPFDIVFLNEEFPPSNKNKIIKKIKGLILNKDFMPYKKNSSWQTTEAYAITPTGAEKFYHKIKNDLGAIDAHIRQAIFEDIRIRAYSLFSPIFSQSHKDSDIQEKNKF